VKIVIEFLLCFTNIKNVKIGIEFLLCFTNIKYIIEYLEKLASLLHCSNVKKNP